MWVGAAASLTAWGIVQSLKDRWPEVHVIAADSGPRERCAASAIADAFVQVPSALEPGWLDAMCAGLREHRVDTLVPVHDLEIVAVAEALDAGALGDPPPACTAPPQHAARVCLDKLEAGRRLEHAGVPVPRTLPGGDDFDGPCVVKPRTGVASRGVRLLDDGAQRTAVERTEAYVVQQRLHGPEVTVDAFGTRRAVARERLEVRAGVASKCRVFADDGLAALAADVARALGLEERAFCFQVIDGRVTDVNPRPGGATRMTVVAGVDVHTAMAAAAWGEDPEPYLPALAREVHVARGALDVVTG